MAPHVRQLLPHRFFCSLGFLDSHGHAEELVFGGGDDHVGLTQHLQVIVFTGQEAPVQDVTVQQTTGLRKDLCRTPGGEEETHS